MRFNLSKTYIVSNTVHTAGQTTRDSNTSTWLPRQVEFHSPHGRPNNSIFKHCRHGCPATTIILLERSLDSASLVISAGVTCANQAGWFRQFNWFESTVALYWRRSLLNIGLVINLKSRHIRSRDSQTRVTERAAHVVNTSRGSSQSCDTNMKRRCRKCNKNNYNAKCW